MERFGTLARGRATLAVIGPGASALAAGRLAAGAVAASLLAACGASPPREEDVYHESSLRPGTVAAETDAERELLARFPGLTENETVRLGDHTFVVLAGYASASGRRCVPVREQSSAGDRTRVACETEAGWTFVPDVFGGDDPFAATAGSP